MIREAERRDIDAILELYLLSGHMSLLKWRNKSNGVKQRILGFYSGAVI